MTRCEFCRQRFTERDPAAYACGTKRAHRECLEREIARQDREAASA